MSSDYGLRSGGGTVMPFYLVCDVSWSMRDEIATLQHGVRRLWEAIASSPVLDGGAAVCIMTFSDDLKIPVPLTQVSTYQGDLPDFACERETDYGRAFRALATRMAQDCVGLRRMRFNVYRPCVYFLTGSEPTDFDWHDTFKATLTEEPLKALGMPEAPVFVPFGFRRAQEHVLRRLAYPGHAAKCYHAKNTTIEQALDGLLDIIQKSIMSSSRSMLVGAPEHILPNPEHGSGIIRYDAGD